MVDKFKHATHLALAIHFDRQKFDRWTTDFFC